jgi:CubicO group peptidase (beta-lactamase class C family)
MSCVEEIENYFAAKLCESNHVAGASASIHIDGTVQTVYTGYACSKSGEKMGRSHLLQCASLSKTVGTAFAIEYLKSKGIDFATTAVNDLLLRLNSNWRIDVAPEANLPPDTCSQVLLPMLVNHTALGMHYVYGFPIIDAVPTCADILNCSPIALENKYQPLFLARKPGQTFSYSGGGFIVLQYIIELMEGVSVDILTQEFLRQCDLEGEFFFSYNSIPRSADDGEFAANLAHGYDANGREVQFLQFPSFAAGALCTPSALGRFLTHLTTAYHNPDGSRGISHSTAKLMLDSLLDCGAMEFMGSQIGLGIFVAEAGRNKICLHQAANDGFRGTYMYCFDGPDQGKGFVLLLNGDNPAVDVMCDLARFILGPRGLAIKNMDFSVIAQDNTSFDLSSTKQETIVNKALRDLVIRGFMPSSPASKL